jgi:hypothetical protein
MPPSLNLSGYLQMMPSPNNVEFVASVPQALPWRSVEAGKSRLE